MNVFVLVDNTHFTSYVIGVFDHADISDDELKQYYGDNIERLHFSDVRDSGLEWMMDIRTSDGEIIRLCLLEYTINVI